jgi:hypothetical protein
MKSWKGYGDQMIIFLEEALMYLFHDCENILKPTQIKIVNLHGIGFPLFC